MHIKNTIILIILSIILSSCAVLEVIYITPGIIMWQIDQWLENDPVKYADLEANHYKCCSEDYLEHLPEPPIIEIPFNAHKADEEITIDFKVPARRTAYRFSLEFHVPSKQFLALLKKYKIKQNSGYLRWIPVSQEFSLIKLAENKTTYTNADRLIHLYDQKQTEHQSSQTIYKGNFTPGYYRLSLKNLKSHPHLKDIKTSVYIRYGGGGK